MSSSLKCDMPQRNLAVELLNFYQEKSRRGAKNVVRPSLLPNAGQSIEIPKSSHQAAQV
jgi:hypothetical protein